MYFLFSDGQLFNVQASQPSNFTCGTCGKGFRMKQHLKQHLLIHTGDKPYKCQVCLKNFRRKDHLEKHAFTQHGRYGFAGVTFYAGQ